MLPKALFQRLLLFHRHRFAECAVLGLVAGLGSCGFYPVPLVLVSFLKSSQLAGNPAVLSLLDFALVHPLFGFAVILVKLFGGHLKGCLLLAGALFIFVNPVGRRIFYWLKANLDGGGRKAFRRYPSRRLGLYNNLGFFGKGTVICLAAHLFISPHLIAVWLPCSFTPVRIGSP